jgi:hypothetical protein
LLRPPAFSAGIVDFAVASALGQLTNLSLFLCVLRSSSVPSVLNLLIFLCVLSLSAVRAIPLQLGNARSNSERISPRSSLSPHSVRPRRHNTATFPIISALYFLREYMKNL